jgi:uncharacterized protein YjbI with pentapeptide repeats
LSTRLCSFDRKALELGLRKRGYEAWDAALLLLPVNWRCNRRALKNSNFCIFHSEKKEPTTFEQALQRELASKVMRFDFVGVIFPESGVDLSGISLGKAASFLGAHFKGPTFFYGATFHEVSFEKATFDWEVTFKNAMFKGKTSFADARLIDSSFRGACFFETANFDYTTFMNGNFFETTFNKSASFKFAEFQDTSFVDTDFRAQVDFTSCTISGCDFDDAMITGPTYFDRTKFTEASFEATTFMRPVSFDDCTFLGSCKFTNTVFLYEVSFREVRIDTGGGVWFVGDPAASTADIVEEYNDETHPSLDDRARIELDRQREAASSGHISLRLVSLVGSNVSAMHFLNVDWNSKSYGIWPFSRTRSALFDELQHEGSGIPGDYENVAATYRQLRRNYEDELRYHEAGDFYVGEMEMRRLQLSCQSNTRPWRWIRRNVLSLLALYRNISFYGESYMLSSLWILAIIVLFAMARITSVTFVCNPVGPTFVSIMKIRDLLDQSVLAFFQLKSESNLDLVERLIGAFLTAMLFIPLKRHFERR